MIGFLIRDVYSDLKSPYLQNKPLDKYGSIKHHFGYPTYICETVDGNLFYRKNCDFLKKPEKWNVTDIDDSITPATITYEFRNQIFTERAYYNHVVNYRGKKRSHFNVLCDLSRLHFKYSKFEKIIGYFQPDNDEEGLLYHLCTDSMSLDEISSDLREPNLDSLQIILAQSLRSLNDQGIFYGECQPTNVGYKNRKIIFKPHNCISIGDLGENVHDVAAVLYTNDWIFEKKIFCKYYLGNDSDDREITLRFIKSVEEGIEWLEIGDTSQMHGWLGRNLINVLKEDRNCQLDYRLTE